RMCIEGQQMRPRSAVSDLEDAQSTQDFPSQRCGGLSGSTILKSLSIFGEKVSAGIGGFRIALMKSLRMVEPSANWSSVARREKSLVLNAILSCGIIWRAEADLGCKRTSHV